MKQLYAIYHSDKSWLMDVRAVSEEAALQDARRFHVYATYALLVVPGGDHGVRGL